jgi:2-polyprenyl-3-methyl-5-hydroxy-6-metoxy-1,4-benzoquinol methylase
VTKSPQEIVTAGYDQIAATYLEWSSDHWLRIHWLGQLAEMLKPGARILDLGCGAGIPIVEELVDKGFDAVGIDGSERQIALARERMPGSSFIHDDMTQHQFDAHEFDAVTAFYSITHVPRELHAELFRSIGKWLKPGGMFLASLGCHDEPGWVGNWLGVDMFFSHFDATENIKLLEEAGLKVKRSEVVGEIENGVEVKFLWVIAQS